MSLKYQHIYIQYNYKELETRRVRLNFVRSEKLIFFFFFSILAQLESIFKLL